MKAVCLISGGIDSPVAAYLMQKKGIEIIFLHADIAGKGSNSKVKTIAKKLSPENKIHYFNHKKVLQNIKNKCYNKYTCVLCKRAMYCEAEKLCKKLNADFIITGENLGQVASQTLPNLKVLDEAVNTPIIRPLIGLNKEEIINIAKQIGTYELSIKNAGICPFVPRKPSTSARIIRIKEEESRII